jgi:hypothetical protein
MLSGTVAGLFVAIRCPETQGGSWLKQNRLDRDWQGGGYQISVESEYVSADRSLRLYNGDPWEVPMASPPLPQFQAQLQWTYVDRPEISETYVDALWRVYFDGNAIRMDFVVNRLDNPQAQAPQSGKAFTASRIVVPLLGMADMLNKLQDIMGRLQAQGTVRQAHPPNITQRPN